MGLCGSTEETEEVPEEVESPVEEEDPLEALKRQIQEARDVLIPMIDTLTTSNAHARYMMSTLNKYKQCNQELSTLFDDECELHKAVEYHIAEQDAMDIRKATYGMGTDEMALAKVIVGRLPDAIALVNEIYQKDYDKDLESLINKEGRSLTGLITGSLSDFGKFMSYRVMPQPRRDALLLKKCMTGLGCADKPLVEILSTRTNDELKAAAEAYMEAFEEDMVERIKSETGGMMSKNYGKWIDTLVEFDRDESEDVPDDVADLAERLYKAGKGKTFGTDEDVFLEILCKANQPTIDAISAAYTEYKGGDLIKDIASEMTGDLEFSNLARVRSKYVFLSKRIYDACKGLGTDEEIIARVLGCLTNSEVSELVKTYEEYYADKDEPYNNFRALMESELSGDFLAAIIMCLENPAPKGHWTVKALYEPQATVAATEFQEQVVGAYNDEGAIEIGGTEYNGPIQLVGMDDPSSYFLCPNIDDDYDSPAVKEVDIDREYLLECDVDDVEAAQAVLDALKEKTAEFEAAHATNETTVEVCKPKYDELAYTMKFLDSQARQLMDDNSAMMNFSVERSVDTVREACEGWGADEHRLIKVLCSLSKKQLFQVDERYKEKFGKSLKEEMDGELSAFFGNAKYFASFMDILLVPPAQYDAKLLLESMKGWGTDESILSEVLCTRTNLELKAAKKIFEENQSKSVEEWVRSETEGDDEGLYMKFLLRCLKADRKEVQVDEELAATQAATLAENGLKEGDLDADALFEILATVSPEQMELITAAYDGDLMEDLKDKLEGDAEKAVLIRCTGKHVYFAKVLDKAWKGMGTDEDATSRVFGRSTKTDIKKIAEEYTKLTGTDFKEAIESEVGGVYKKALLTYVFNDPPPVTREEPPEEEAPAEEE